MSPDPTAVESEHDSHPYRRQRFGLTLAVALALTATAFSYFGTRDTWLTPGRRPDVTLASLSTTEMDPAWDLDLPQGPNRQEFQTSCMICHSARLPLGQPRFKREKWVEVVHKMVAAYGAPLTPEDEAKVVEYLLVARPPGP
jgi:hypothetical protein